MLWLEGVEMVLADSVIGEAAVSWVRLVTLTGALPIVDLPLLPLFVLEIELDGPWGDPGPETCGFINSGSTYCFIGQI